MNFQNGGLDQVENNEFGEVLHGYMRSSNGVLESLLRAVMLRKLDEQNRARNVKKQSYIWEWNTRMLELIEQNDGKVNIALILVQTNNDFGPTAGCFV